MTDGGVSDKNGSERAVIQLQVIWTCYRWNNVCEVMTGRAEQLKSPSATADQICQLYSRVGTKQRVFSMKYHLVDLWLSVCIFVHLFVRLSGSDNSSWILKRSVIKTKGASPKKCSLITTCLFTRLDRVQPGPSRVSNSPVSAKNVIYEDFVLMRELR